MDIAHPIAELVGEARGRLLESVVRSDRPDTIRGWSRRAEMTHPQAGVLLSEFEQMGLVESEQVGRSTSYRPIEESLIRRRLRSLLLLRDEIVSYAREQAAEAPAGTRVVLFGSIARNSPHDASDLDICVIADSSVQVDDWLVKYESSLERASSLVVNMLRFTPTEWVEAAARGEAIAKDVARDGIVLQEGRVTV